MSFNAKYYQEAESRISERRQRGERMLESREAQLEKTHPEIMGIQRELSLTSARLIDLILSKDDDFERKLAELEKNNLLLQEKLKDSLQKSGFPRDYLEQKYECEKCRDTGVLNGRRCSCFMDAVRTLAAQELNRSSMLSLCEFSDFDLNYYDNARQVLQGCTARDIMQSNLDICRRYAEDFHLPYRGLFMRGATGLGKTHLSLSIANEVIKKGYNVVYGSAPDLFRKMEQEHFGHSDGDTAGMLQSAELLIIDDLGAEFESKFNSAAVYGLINNRINASLPTIFSTNCELSELTARYGERVMSRFAVMEQLIFVGSDIRIRKAKENR